MTTDEKLYRISELKRGKRSFEQTTMLSVLACLFLIYNAVKAYRESGTPWYFYIFIAAVIIAAAAIGYFNHKKSKRAENEITRLTNELKAENPEIKIPEDNDQRRFF